MQNQENKIKVILVEDHKLVRVGLKSLFEKCGDILIVAEAQTGKEGLEKAHAHKADVIIIDIGLDDISGIEVAKRINASENPAKIMILTSKMDEQSVIDSLKAGVYAYVSKDINSEMLAMIIRSVNMGAMWLDPRATAIVRETPCGVMPQKTKSRANFKATHANLTEREYEVLKLVVDGKSNQEIANILKISEHTSKAHVCNIIQKLVVDDRTQAAVKALKEGLV